jgi:hypothetical protein
MANMTWRKSSYSSNGGADCIEVARDPQGGSMVARDSKHPNGPQLGFDAETWNAFMASVKLGKFDLT